MDKYVVVVERDGDMYRKLNGMRHCDTGPAVEDLWGYMAWFLSGERHRLDGPAVIYSDEYDEDEWHKEWHINGVELTEEEFNEETSKPHRLKRTITADHKRITP